MSAPHLAREVRPVPDYDPRTALAVVDLQNDFADPGGNLYVPGGEETSSFANDEIRRANDADAVIVYTQDWHPPSTPHFKKDGGVWPVHCVRDTWGAEFHPQLRISDGAVYVRKGTGGEDGYSAFTMADPTTGERSPTQLEALLRDRYVERLVIVGLATDYCVKETAIEGVAKGFDTMVLREGVRAVEREPGDGRKALEAMRAAGVTLA